MVDSQKNKERFLQICRDVIKRPGIDKLLAWLEKSDFYSAPASTRFHLSEYGGLLAHSLNVYDEMKRLCVVYEQFTSVSEETENREVSKAIVEQIHKMVSEHIASHEEDRQKIYDLTKKYAKDSKGKASVNYNLITDPVAAGKLLEELAELCKKQVDSV